MSGSQDPKSQPDGNGRETAAAAGHGAAHGHAHGHEHPNPNLHDDPSVGPVLFYGVAGSLIFVAIVIWLAALVYDTQNNITAERVYRAEVMELVDLRSRQLAAIEGYRFVDKDRGIVAIPIERAMRIAARQIAERGDAQLATPPAGAAASQPHQNP